MVKSTQSRALRLAEAPFILKGGRLGDQHVIAPWCDAPIPIQIGVDQRRAVPELMPMVSQFGEFSVAQRYHSELNLGVACRKCEGCRRHKRKLWAARAYHECLLSQRTWFGTLTFRPALHAQAMRLCHERAWGDGLNFSSLPLDDQLRIETEQLYPVVQRFLKRLRKAGYRFRYLMVAEPHKSGLVHFHLLVHETTNTGIPKAKLEEQWRAGVSHWRLVQTGDRRAVWYVCKYLGKEGSTKPRASLAYGRPIDAHPPKASGSRPGALPPDPDPEILPVIDCPPSIET